VSYRPATATQQDTVKKKKKKVEKKKKESFLIQQARKRRDQGLEPFKLRILGWICSSVAQW
jgi:hypothetical protein